MKHSRKLSILVVLLFVAFVSLAPTTDMDLGWHLRYGQYFFQTGRVLRDNIISFVWPDYKWVQASWGYDLILYQLFTRLNFIGLSVAAAILTTLTFAIVIYPPRRFRFFQLLFLAVLFTSQAALGYVAGLRAQTLSAVFFALAMSVRNWFYLPILFFVWANTHGGFALGLGLLFLIWIMHGIMRTSTNWKPMGVALLLSLCATLISPWGIRTYDETIHHLTNKNLSLVGEWMPLTQAPVETGISLLVVALVVFVAIRKRTREDIPYLFAFGVVVYLALSAIRFTIPFGVMATYYIAKHMTYRFSFIARVALLLIIGVDMVFTNRYFAIPSPRILSFSWKDYCNVRPCSEEITEIMLKDPPRGNGYATGSYGSYLSWRVPQVKTFIDGRMAAWVDDGKTPAVVSDMVPTEKAPVTWRMFESTYDFRWAILPTASPNASYLDSLVTASQWRRLYRDERWSYYVKN